MDNTPKKSDSNPNIANNIKTGFASYWGIWVILAVLFVFLTLKISDFKPHAGEKVAATEAVKQPVFGEPGYVGSTRCKDCHWLKHDTWKNTLHSKFMQPVNDYTVMGDFERNNTLTVTVSDASPKLAGETVTSTMFNKDGKYYVNTIGPDWELHDYEISHVIGLGRTQDYLSTFPNGEIHVLPVQWNIKTASWTDLNGMGNNLIGDGEYWSDSESIWQFKCGGCHVTGMDINYDETEDQFDTTWVDRGIACEACHGPGSNHVKAASEYFDYEKDTIVNPAKLPWWLRAMVCGQCHNWGASTAEVAEEKEGFPTQYSYSHGYRPGKALYLFYTENNGEKKKHHQQYNEWRTSKHGEVGIMCTNCHNVHQEEDTKIAMTKSTTNSLCMECHVTLQPRAAHRIHTFGSCVACHMPKTVGHEHSHTFQFVSPALSVAAGGVDKQPNSCNGCHHHKDSDPAELAGFLEAAKKNDMPKPFAVHQRAGLEIILNALEEVRDKRTR